jgi:hypothetical protein
MKQSKIFFVLVSIIMFLNPAISEEDQNPGY